MYKNINTKIQSNTKNTGGHALSCITNKTDIGNYSLSILGHDLSVLNAPSIKNNISFFTCEVTENIKSLTLETKQELPML